MAKVKRPSGLSMLRVIQERAAEHADPTLEDELVEGKRAWRVVCNCGVVGTWRPTARGAFATFTAHLKQETGMAPRHISAVALRSDTPGLVDLPQNVRGAV